MQPKSPPNDPFRDYQPRPPEPHRICGAAPVRALFLRRPEAVQRLFYTEAMRRIAGPLCAHLARTRRPYREVPPEELARIAGTQHHGGICAVTEVRFAERLPGHALPADLPVARLLPVLDGIGNPHNLGAIARSAAFFGCRALLLSEDPRQADLSDAAFRTAEGGLELLGCCGRGSCRPAAWPARPYLVAAAVAAGGVPPEALPRDRPIALVLGNEEQGPSAAVLEACEAGVTLPGSGLVDSLNVGRGGGAVPCAGGQPAPPGARPMAAARRDGPAARPAAPAAPLTGRHPRRHHRWPRQPPGLRRDAGRRRHRAALGGGDPAGPGLRGRSPSTCRVTGLDTAGAVLLLRLEREAQTGQDMAPATRPGRACRPGHCRRCSTARGRRCWRHRRPRSRRCPSSP